MKTYLIGGAIALVLLLIAGFGYFKLSSRHAMQAPQLASPTAKPSFLSDIFGKTVSVQCSYTDDQGRSTVAYVKAGAVRADMTTKQTTDAYGNGSVIIKDKKMYFWSADKKQGFMMDLATVTEAPAKVTPGAGTTQANSSQDQSASVLASVEKFKENCKPMTISDTLFVPPADVKFSSISDMMKGSLPTGVMPSGVPSIPAQYQQYMPSYKTPAQ